MRGKYLHDIRCVNRKASLIDDASAGERLLASSRSRKILKALDNKSKRSGKSCEISDKLVNLNERSSVNSLIVRGKAGAAKKRIFEHVQTDESHPTPAELGLVALYLSCQECVELIRETRFQPQLITPRPPFALVSFNHIYQGFTEIGSHFLATRFLVKVQSAHF